MVLIVNTEFDVVIIDGFIDLVDGSFYGVSKVLVVDVYVASRIVPFLGNVLGFYDTKNFIMDGIDLH